MNEKILIIIPAYNESGNIERVITEIQSLKFPLLDIVVVDDGSEDTTAQEARNFNVNVISHPFNLGIGSAVQTGLQFAHYKGYDLAIQVDGDGQHDPAFLGKLVEPIAGGQADMAVGSRFIKPFLGYQSSFVRRIGIHFFAYLISFLTGYKVTDPTSGFRAFNRKVIAAFSEYYPQDFPEPEAIVIAQRMGFSLIEVPVKMRERLFGYSSIRYLKTLYYMIKVTFAILLDKIKQKRKGD